VGLIAEMIEFMTLQSRVAGGIGVLSQSIIDVVSDSIYRYIPRVTVKSGVLSACIRIGGAVSGRVDRTTGYIVETPSMAALGSFHMIRDIAMSIASSSMSASIFRRRSQASWA